jgi:dienelactone hydrolase
MAGWAHRFAAILAAHGFLALPLGYGEGSLWGAGQIRDVPLGRVVEAAEALAGLTREGKVGVFGWSKGAEKTLLLASLLDSADPIACVAAHAPPDRVTAAFDPTKVDLTAPKVLKVRRDDPKAWAWHEDSYRLDPGAEIEIERYPGPVFLSVGTADEVWDHRMTLALAERLEDAGRPADLFVAEGQGHGFDFDTEPELWARLTAFLGRHLQA